MNVRNIARAATAVFFPCALGATALYAQCPYAGYGAVNPGLVTMMDVGTGGSPWLGQTVVIDGSHTGAVEPGGQVRILEGTPVMNLSGHTVIPGMIKLHSHPFCAVTASRPGRLTYGAARPYMSSGPPSVRTMGGMHFLAENSPRIPSVWTTTGHARFNDSRPVALPSSDAPRDIAYGFQHPFDFEARQSEPGRWAALPVGYAIYGAWETLGISVLLIKDTSLDDLESLDELLAVSLAGGVAGGYIGSRLARGDPLLAEAVIAAAYWSTGFGAAAGAAAGLGEGHVWLTAGLAGPVGIAIAVFADRWGLGRRRARDMGAGGVLGLVAGWGVVVALEELLRQEEIQPGGGTYSESPVSDAVAYSVLFGSGVAGTVLGFLRSDAGSEDQEAMVPEPRSGSLLTWSSGRLGFSTPLPTPIRVTTNRPEGQMATAWRIPLLDIRF